MFHLGHVHVWVVVSFWYEARQLAAMHEFVNQGNLITLCEV